MVDVGFHVTNASTFCATPAPSVPLFDSYVVVDWSGASSPRLGKDSIWYCVVDRHDRSPLPDSHRDDAGENKPKKKLKGGPRGYSTGTSSHPNGSVDSKGGSKSKAETRHDTNFRIRCIENVATREAATVCLKGLINGFLTESPPRRALVGWDFSFGFPQGFADALGLHDSSARKCKEASSLGCGIGTENGTALLTGRERGNDWARVWEYLDRVIEDEPTNANNRFKAASEMNQKISSGPSPFWACPPSHASPYLRTTKPTPAPTPTHPLPEKRLCEQRCRAQSTWKLFTTGAVGSQTLLGIPRVNSLCVLNPQRIVVWPFQTGLRPPRMKSTSLTIPHKECVKLSQGKPCECAEGAIVVMAEVYPSLVPPACFGDEPKDAGQVRALALHFAQLDTEGLLEHLFRGPLGNGAGDAMPPLKGRKKGKKEKKGEEDNSVKLLTPEEVVILEEQEGWILGVT